MTLKKTILREAMFLFEQRGIDAVSEEEMQRILNISPATFQSFFQDKEELLLQAYQQRLADDKERHAELQQTAANPVEEILRLVEYGSRQLGAVSAAYIHDVIKRPAILQAFQEHVEEYSYPQIYQILNSGISSGHFRKELNLPIVTRIILESVSLLLNTRVFPPEKFNARDIFRSMYLYYIRGLCTESAMPLTDRYFA